MEPFLLCETVFKYVSRLARTLEPKQFFLVQFAKRITIVRYEAIAGMCGIFFFRQNP